MYFVLARTRQHCILHIFFPIFYADCQQKNSLWRLSRETLKTNLRRKTFLQVKIITNIIDNFDRCHLIFKNLKLFGQNEENYQNFKNFGILWRAFSFEGRKS
eukprot:TCONS_00053778-protein